MTTQAVLSYVSTVFSNAAALQAALAKPELDPTILTALGLGVLTDATVAAERTVTVGFNPTVPATAVAVLLPGSPPLSGSPVLKVSLTAAGQGFVVPPIVTFSGGTGDLSPELIKTLLVPTVPAAAIARLNVLSITVTNPGSGYTAPTVTLVGGLSLAPILPGVAATAGADVFGGAITTINVVSAGEQYTSVPEVVITDPTGTGATAVAVMQVSEILLLRTGSGYVTPPTVTLTPWFQYAFPAAAGDQAAPLKNLYTETLQTSALAQVQALTPVIT